MPVSAGKQAAILTRMSFFLFLNYYTNYRKNKNNFLKNKDKKLLRIFSIIYSFQFLDLISVSIRQIFCNSQWSIFIRDSYIDMRYYLQNKEMKTVYSSPSTTVIFKYFFSQEILYKNLIICRINICVLFAMFSLLKS